MPQTLSKAQIEQYRDHGFLAPLDLMSEAGTGQVFRKFRRLEDKCNDDVPHLVSSVLDATNF